MTSRRGLALIVTVGILVLLSVAATAMVGMAAQLRTQSGVWLDHSSARLLARSGIEYGSARLFEDASPRTPPTQQNQQDDWTYREGIGKPLETALNPSYAQAEPYADVNGNGCYDRDVDVLAGGGDWNGNGRFDSWSGRLRMRGGMYAGAFSLKVSSEDAKIDVNTGVLSSEDRNNSGTPDCSDLDYRQLRPRTEVSIKNVRVADAVNTLGQAVSAVSISATPPIPLNGTGDLLIQKRPLGGYQSLDELENVLGRPAWKNLEPYLSLSGNRRAKRGTRFYSDERKKPSPTAYWPGFGDYGKPPDWVYPSVERVPALNLSVSDRPLLQSLFAGLMGYSWAPGQTGYTLGQCGIGFLDAGRVADFLIANRPFRSRYDLFARLEAAKADLFPLDASWDRSIKVNLVASNAEADPTLAPGLEGHAASHVPLAASFPSFSWCSYDVPRWLSPDRPLWPGGDARIERTAVDFRWSALPVPDAIPTFPMEAFLLGAAGIRLAPLDSFPVSLQIPSRFAVESVSRKGGAKAAAAFSTRDLMEAASQADFENGDGNATRPPGMRVLGRPRKDRLQTYPRFPLDSATDLAQASDGGPDPRYAFPEDFGTLALMAYAGWRDGNEIFFQPCWEAGQPLRPVSLPAEALWNFADASSSPIPAAYAGAEQYGANAVFGTLADELLFPYADYFFSWMAAYSAPPPVCTPYLRMTWPPGTCGWFGEEGKFRGGSFDFWGTMIGYTVDFRPDASGQHPPAFTFGITGGAACSANNATTALAFLPRSDLRSTVFFDETVSSNLSAVEYLSIGAYAVHAYHRVVFTLDSATGQVTGFVDGVQDPGLRLELPMPAGDPTQSVALLPGNWSRSGAMSIGQYGYGWFNRGCGARLHAGPPIGPAGVLARSLQPFYWTTGIVPPGSILGGTDFGAVPSFTSPLYNFPSPVHLAGAGWEGFVPRLIREETEAWNSANPGDPKVPLRVELLIYSDAAGEGRQWGVPLLPESWAEGGGHRDFPAIWKSIHGDAPIPKAGSFRYKVWMDASAVEGFSNETPVFDSISVYYKSSGKVLSLSGE